MNQPVQTIQDADKPLWFVTGVHEVPTVVAAGSWLTALGAALEEHGLMSALKRLTVERRGPTSAVAIDPHTGRLYAVHAAT